jgi:hypothetical protein
MLKIFLVLAAAVASLMIAGCTGDPLTQDNGRGAVMTADAGHTHSDVGGQQPKQDAAPVCVPQCGGKNCGDNGCGGQCGTCSDTQVCDTGGVCVLKMKPLSHACATSTTCDAGERCWCDTNGAFTCYALTGMCVTSGGKELCESTSSYTSSCGSGSNCVGVDMSVKSAMCSAGSTSCTTTGCAMGYACNSGSGKCEAVNSGSGTCVIRQLEGKAFTVFGGGVTSIEMAEAGWNQTAQATGSAGATLSVGGASYFSFNAQRADGIWAYGWDGISPSNITKVVGNWQIDCSSIVSIKLYEGPQLPTCGSSLSIGGVCYWAKPNEFGKYRIVVRLK